LAKLLDGNLLAAKIKEDLKREIASLKLKPVLASIIVGDNCGAASYVKSQNRIAGELGINYQLHNLNQNSSEKDLADFIQRLNSDKSVNGIILQMPLPAQIDYKRISQFIAPEKDIEGMNPSNIGKLLFGASVKLGARFVPCAAAAAMELISVSGVDLRGKEAVVVGHSEIVGKPLALLLLDKFATVTVCHIATSEALRLEEHTRRADVLIVAVGKAGLIKGGWIKKDAVVIDVGINRVDGKIVGDVEFEGAEKLASYITPVPGGVGPLTVIMLMRNLVEAAKLQQ
jgi:methylenetetrahydrofolate dehydrogenase (NADP+)/methenyltetrahydrofolate cyclohydrolase